MVIKMLVLTLEEKIFFSRIATLTLHLLSLFPEVQCRRARPLRTPGCYWAWLQLNFPDLEYGILFFVIIMSKNFPLVFFFKLWFKYSLVNKVTKGLCSWVIKMFGIMVIHARSAFSFRKYFWSVWLQIWVPFLWLIWISSTSWWNLTSELLH